METNVIYNQDCLEGMRELPGESVTMTLTDIPYGEVTENGEERAKYDGQLRNINKSNADVIDFSIDNFVKETIRVTSDNIYIFCGASQLSKIHTILDNEGLSTRIIVWEKTNPSPMNGQHLWLSGIEYAVYGRKTKGTFNDNCRNTVLEYPSGSSKIHPTQKPVELFRDLIRVSSNKGDIILDPCIGSGTTAIACYEENREYIGFEKSGEYYKNCIERVEKEISQMRLFG